jgi:hypothetical protein
MVPAQRTRKQWSPPIPSIFRHQLVHRKEANYKDEHVPEEASFYEDIAGGLVNADEIVLVGHGTGKSSAVDYLSEYLQKHRPETFQHVKPTESADLSDLTKPQIETIAKSHMIAVV